jgi:hypothetical protein
MQGCVSVPELETILSYLIGYVLKDGSSLIQHGSIVQDKSRHIALGINLVEISTGCREVSLQIHSLKVKVNASNESGNERCRAARSGGIVKLGHC